MPKCKEEKNPDQHTYKNTKTKHPGIWDNFKRCNIHTIGIPEGEQRKKYRREFSKIPNKHKITGPGNSEKQVG